MVDLITTGAVAYVSKDLLIKLLGPSVEYLGLKGKGLFKKIDVDISPFLKDIFVKASKILGNKLDEEGTVNPRVLKDVIMDGSFCQNELSREYFAGVLAASRTENGTDDRGVYFSKLITSMSSCQIRSHYLFYKCIRNLFVSFAPIISPGTDRDIMVVYIPTASYFEAMNINNDLIFLAHSINGLRRNRLVEDNCIYGQPGHFLNEKNLIYRFEKFPVKDTIFQDHGMIIQPSPSGIELFLWANGMNNIKHQDFLNSDIELQSMEEIIELKNVRILYENFIKNRFKTLQNK